VPVECVEKLKERHEAKSLRQKNARRVGRAQRMKCPNCGTENPASKIVCTNCGRRLRPGRHVVGPTVQTEKELMAWVRGDMRRLGVVTAIVVAVGIALGYVIH